SRCKVVVPSRSCQAGAAMSVSCTRSGFSSVLVRLWTVFVVLNLNLLGSRIRRLHDAGRSIWQNQLTTPLYTGRLECQYGDERKSTQEIDLRMQRLKRRFP